MNPSGLLLCNSFGPWFVALLFNTSPPSVHDKKHKDQTELVAHTYPHLMVDVLNAKHPHSVWIILMKVGPFERWADCSAFARTWSAKTRGRAARIEKGIRLWHESPRDMTLWLQTQDKNVLVEDYRSKKRARKERDDMFLEDMRVYTMREMVVHPPAKGGGMDDAGE
jgi:hypothetical protein